MRNLALPPLLLLTVLLAACGSSAGTSSVSSGSGASSTATSTPASTGGATDTPTTSATGATSTAVSTTTTATTTTSATTTAAATGSPLCRASGLRLSFLGQQGGMGQGEIGFALRNVSGASCHTYGYPGVLFLDRAGRPLPTVPTHTTSDFFGTSPKVPLAVAAGATFSFRLAVTHGVGSSAGCTDAYGLQVIPPDDTGTVRTTFPEGAYECRTANVSPVRSGQSAFP